MAEPHYTIKAVAKRTGLSPHVIRIWEKRYGAVKPTRTHTNRRLYSEEDAQRLLLLRNAIQAGHSIGTIHALPKEELQGLASNGAEHNEAAPEQVGFSSAVEAIRAMDAVRLEKMLEQRILTMGQHGLLERYIAPLTQEIGDLWQSGAITAAHEHFASAVIRAFLTKNSRPFAWTADMPTLVVGTPSGQLHELGAVIVGAAAGDAGWRVVYLGSSLPAAEIAGAAIQNRARAVALSIVYPTDDPHLAGELESLRRYMPTEVRIIVGGRAAGAYSEALTRIGAVRQNGLAEFYKLLEQLRANTRLR